MKNPLLFVLSATIVIAISAKTFANQPHPTMQMASSARNPAGITAAIMPATALHAGSAWVRAAPPGAMMLAGYMTLRNDGRIPQQFVSAQSAAFGMVELHRTLVVDGISTMRPAGDQVIPAGGSLRLEPGGLHFMLMQPRRALRVGDTVRFRLYFSDGSAMDVDAKVSAEAPAVTR